jgi:hypothetical protein
MRRILFGLITTFAISATLIAQDNPAVSFEQLTVTASVQTLARATVNPSGKPAAQYCSGLLETADVRVRVDGPDPTATIGQFVPVGATVRLRGADTIRRFAAIRTGGTSGVLAMTCYGSQPGVGPPLEVVPAAIGATVTGSGYAVYATSPTIVTPTLTNPTVTTGTFTGVSAFSGGPVFSGEPLVSGRLLVRESFEQAHWVTENDTTAKSLADGAINVVVGSPLGLITYREEQAKTASSWVESAGALDISADDGAADNEGVEIYIGDLANVATGLIKTGTSGLCFEVNFTVTLIAGTDQFFVGWREAEAVRDDGIYTGYNDWAGLGINNIDGSIFANEEINAGAGAKSDDSGVNAVNGGSYTLKSCILATGVPTASLDGTAITLTNGSTALTAATYLNPFINYLGVTGTDAGVKINWMQLTPLP